MVQFREVATDLEDAFLYVANEGTQAFGDAPRASSPVVSDASTTSRVSAPADGAGEESAS